MIIGTMYWKKAVPALMVGIAFFLMSCQPVVLVKKEEIEEIKADHFALAELYWQEGDYDRALDEYGAYLEQTPKGKKAALALHRMAEIYFRTEEYGKALEFLNRIPREYPDYPGLPAVQYQVAMVFYRLGEYMLSMDEALKWLEKYPGHPLMGDAMLLLGNNFKRLGDDFQAFDWWLKAKQESLDDLRVQAELNEKLEDLIKKSGTEDLERLAGYAAGTGYEPRIYYRIATIFLEQNEPEKAQKAAMSLIRATPEQYWVSKGRELLENIQELLSVRRGVVGCLLPLSGPFAIYGEAVLNGIELGMGIFDEPGHGPDLELVIKDTEGKPERAVAGLEDLVDNEKAMAIIGPLSSRTAVTAARKAQELGVPMIALTQKQGIVEEGDMVFRNFLTPPREVKRVLDVAVGEMAIRRFAILYPDNSYGRYFMNLFWDRLEEMGGIVTAVESYNPDETDFADQIKKMTGLYYPRPDSVAQRLIDMRTPEEEECIIFPEEPEPIIDFDAVFIPDNFQRVAMVAPQLVYHDVVDVLLLGTSLWQSPQLIEMAGDYVQGAIFPSGFFESSGGPGVSAFTEEYRENFDSTPGILAATGYDTIRILQEAMAGERVRTRKNLQKGLLECQGFEGVTGDISFDSKGEVQNEPLLLTVTGKRIALYPKVVELLSSGNGLANGKNNLYDN